MTKKIILLGPQGCGKGTQAAQISGKYNIPHISTGDIFRYNIKNQTPLGMQVKAIIDSGKLVPDKLTCEIVEDRINQEDCKEGFLLDGFPRTIPQAEALDKITNIDYAISINIPDEDVVFRLEGRRTCSNKECGAIYNVNTAPKPLNEKICDKCGAELVQRDDDTKEAIKKRLSEYHEKTSPLIEYYKEKLVEIDGTQEIGKVTKDIFERLD